MADTTGAVLGTDSLGGMILGSIDEDVVVIDHGRTISAVLSGATISAAISGATIFGAVSIASISASVTVNE